MRYPKDIENINQKNSLTSNSIVLKVFKRSFYTIAIVLQNPLNGVIVKVTFLHSLKFDDITQDFEKEDPNGKANYWSDIVFPVVSKLFDRIIRKQMDGCKSKYSCSYDNRHYKLR